jgi:Sulfotransferase family
MSDAVARRAARQIDMTWRNWLATVPGFGPRLVDGVAQSRLLVFDHIPKTAGTTFRRSYLPAALPSEERWILGGGETNASDRERFLALSLKRRDRVRIVAGHNAEMLRPYLPGARFITVVRDPVERAISSYLHARFHEGGEKLWPDVRDQNMSLSQFADRHILPNGQSRILLGEDYERLDDAGITQRLDARYLLVGYTEAFDEFVFMLHMIEGLPLCQYGNRLVRAERQSYQPSADDLARVRQANVVDTRLHTLVKAAFQSRIDALTEQSRAQLKQFLGSLRAFRTEATQ